MNTFKSNIYEICSEVVGEFPGWKFVSGRFKNGALKHSELIIDPGLFFERGFTSMQPSICIRNKRCEALYSKIFEIKKPQIIPVSLVNFQVIADSLEYMPEAMRVRCLICEDKISYLMAIKGSTDASEEMKMNLQNAAVGVGDARSVLVSMVKDGISFIANHYDLSSEENLLRGLPAKYLTRNKIPYDEMEKQKGVILCVVRILLGDFDFVERYADADFKTIFPKRTDELDRIVAALPELKKLYAEAGSVI
ncbi:hypothetical protein [Burkholderia plantarii]|nr:hypothetical protein [Burkholderia plantarii]